MNAGLVTTKLEEIASSSSINSEQDSDEHVIQFMVYFILLVLIVFIIAFIYNLIKCYLPKWRKNERPYQEEIDMKEVPYKMQNVDESV